MKLPPLSREKTLLIIRKVKTPMQSFFLILDRGVPFVLVAPAERKMKNNFII